MCEIFISYYKYFTPIYQISNENYELVISTVLVVLVSTLSIQNPSLVYQLSRSVEQRRRYARWRATFVHKRANDGFESRPTPTPRNNPSIREHGCTDNRIV